MPSLDFCETGFSKVQNTTDPTTACLGRTNTGGCIYLCFKRGQATGGILGLSGVVGDKHDCPEGSKPVNGANAPSFQGGYDFDPQGVGVKLCVQG